MKTIKNNYISFLKPLPNIGKWDSLKKKKNFEND